MEPDANPATLAEVAKPAAPAITVEPAKAAATTPTVVVVDDSNGDEDDNIEDNEVVKALEAQIEKLKKKIAGKAEKRSARKASSHKRTAPTEERGWFRPLIG